MFIGSINRYMRAVLETTAGRWKGLPVYIACSGNFTVERILAKCGVGAIQSNDVSIYSCALVCSSSGYIPLADECCYARGLSRRNAASFAA